MYKFSFTLLNTNCTLAYGEFQGHIDHEADRETVMDASISGSCNCIQNHFRKRLISTIARKCTESFFLLFIDQTAVLCQSAVPVVFLDVKIKTLHKVPSEAF